jgi:hypothetical protein
MSVAQRCYQPGWGRFVTPDPYEGSASTMSPASFDRYSYGYGDPVNHADPTGLKADFVVTGYAFADRAFVPIGDIFGSAHRVVDGFVQELAYDVSEWFRRPSHTSVRAAAECQSGDCRGSDWGKTSLRIGLIR